MPKYWKDRATQKATVEEAITSIIIVPHNDLARQVRQWVKTLDLTRDLNSVVQTLLNDPEESYEEQIKRISKEVPHILVTTPKALEACWSVSQHLLTLDAVSTIVLEEADALLRIPSNNTPIALQRKWRKHPAITKELLDRIFQYRPKKVG
jgi:superfamily II DNA/RNA helicase